VPKPISRHPPKKEIGNTIKIPK
jgi:hypothetical protein